MVMIDTGVTQADFRLGRKAMACEFKPGSIGLFAAGTELNSSRWSWRPARRIFLDLDAGCPMLDESLQLFSSIPMRTEIEFRDVELESVLRIMAAEICNGSPNGQLFAESLSLGVAMRLRTRCPSRIAYTQERGKLTASQLAAVDEVIYRDLEANITLAALAKATLFSPAQFVRLFKNTMGQTPHQYVMTARLKHAQALVTDSGTPLAVVAELTGFSTQSHLTHAFSRRFGVTPGVMRRTARK